MKIDVNEVLKVLNKPAKYGPDVDLSKYELAEPTGTKDRGLIEEGEVIRASKRLGFGTGILKKAGYIQVNEAFLTAYMTKTLEKYGAVVLPTSEAIRKSPLAREKAWSLIPPHKDKYVAATYLYGREQGYFIYVPPGVKVREPIYTCLFITRGKIAQLLHNIVIVDDGAEVNLVTGCGISDIPAGALHIGVSEFFVGKGAKLTYAMIHAWSPRAVVRPRTAVHVEEGGQYVSYYMIYSGVESIQAYPQVFLERNASAYMYSVVAGEGRGVYDIGSAAYLRGEGSNAEIISRILGKGESEVIARARLVGEAGPSKGHIECMGLVTSEKAEVSSVPELLSKSQEAILTHEAAIGKISDEQLTYLMSKGFSEEEARAMIIRGFITIEAPQLPRIVRETVARVVKFISSRAHG